MHFYKPNELNLDVQFRAHNVPTTHDPKDGSQHGESATKDNEITVFVCSAVTDDGSSHGNTEQNTGTGSSIHEAISLSKFVNLRNSTKTVRRQAQNTGAEESTENCECVEASSCVARGKPDAKDGEDKSNEHEDHDIEGAKLIGKMVGDVSTKSTSRVEERQ